MCQHSQFPNRGTFRDCDVEPKPMLLEMQLSLVSTKSSAGNVLKIHLVLLQRKSKDRAGFDPQPPVYSLQGGFDS